VLDARPCFLSILGEFGLTLQALNDPRAPAAVVMLKRVLLDLYAKSGWNNVLRSTAYSDSEKNTKTIHAPNVSFLGDTTPETFYDSIGSADIADGLIPRLQIIEYTGKRPKRNKAAGQPPPPGLVSRFADLAALALTTANNNACANVQTAPDALEALDAFDEECDAHMNGTGHAVEVQLWNRAHLKALKLGALLAVGCNPHNPMVTLELAHWAIAFTRRSTEAIVQRFNVGDVGNGEAKQMVDLRRAIEEYMRADFSDVRSYKVKKEVHAAKLVPYSYLLIRAARMAAFYKDRRGTARALRETLEQCVLSEQLGAVSVQEATAKFGIRQALYFVGGSW
jgi:hypothetical protein